jgi:hypothetical protein
VFVVSDDRFGAAPVLDGKLGDVFGEAAESSGDAEAVIVLAFQPLSQGYDNGLGDRFTGPAGDLPCEPVGFVALDTQRHSRSIDKYLLFCLVARTSRALAESAGGLRTLSL